MQEFDFGFAAGQPGFRLHTLEIYNWGTFNRRVWQLNPGGTTTLLTGPNGAGKTTVVDALVTLLAPPAARHYNQSSGADTKRDRNLKSYLEGAYGTGQDAETGDVTNQVLRPGTGYYSWLSATFRHDDLDQMLTLVHYRRYRQSEAVTHWLVVPWRLSLKEDAALQQLLAGEPAGWRTHLQMAGTFKESSSFEQYAAEWQPRLGVRSEKALTLFGKTVGMKMLGSLDEFVRREMLSDAGGDAAFRELYEAYRHLLDVFHLLQKAEHQARLLQPLVETGRDYLLVETANHETTAALAALPELFGQRKKAVLQRTLAQRQQEVATETARQQETAAALEELKPRILELTLATRNSDAGRRLEQLGEQLKRTAEQLAQKRNYYQEYAQLTRNAGLTAPTTAAEFAAARSQVAEHETTARAAETRQEEALAEQRQLQQQARQHREQVGQELAALRRQRTLIPEEMTRLRQQLCDALDLSTAQLPFMGELLQVKPTEAHWRPAIEKLLHGAGLQLLVPATYAAEVNRYVHATNLRGRLVYQEVSADHPQRSGQLAPDSLVHKLDVAERPLFAAWLRSYLYQHYDYCCTDDLTRFDSRQEPLLLTSSGLIRTRNRHEKDDRPNKTGPRHYVLGWDNQEKITALEEELHAAQQRENALEATIGQHEKTRQQLRDQQLLLGQLLRQESFEALDWFAEQVRLEALQQEQTALQQQRDQDETLRLAQQQLSVAQGREKALNAEKTQIDRRLGALEAEVTKLTTSLHHEQQRWPAEPAPVPPGVWATPPPDPATPEEADQQRLMLQGQLQRRQTEAAEKIRTLEGRLVRLMTQFRRTDQLPEAYAAQWRAECAQLEATPESLSDYEKLYQRLQAEDLPQYQTKFQHYLTGDVLQFVFKFRKTLDNHLRDVKTSIAELNEALEKIDFSRTPRTYIRLTDNDVRGGTAQGIAAFRARLKQALPNQELLASNDPQQAVAAFGRLRELLDELNRDEPTRRRVLDVRNWLQFGAEEVARETGQVLNVYSNSGGRSGGEKAKLAYTVLAAAIAYQYNAMRPNRQQPSFRFVVIDETFSKSDAANSTYALRLFEQLGLQLMIVTPLDNIRLAQPFIRQLHLVRRLPTFESEVWDLTLEEYQQRTADAVPAMAATLPASA